MIGIITSAFCFFLLLIMFRKFTRYEKVMYTGCLLIG